VNKREFLKTVGRGGLGLAAYSLIPVADLSFTNGREKKQKHWAWVTTDVKPSIDEWKKQFADMRQAGIDAILPEIYNSRHAYYGSKHLPVKELWMERILPLAKTEGLEFHAWMWAMPCNIEEVRKQQPEWFSVNRKGESAAEKPAYVDYYKFLCPSRPEVHQFIQTTVTELAQIDTLDGIHLDYIRYPDVILAEGIQPKYGIVQDWEYADYDYCYCEVCRREFKEKTGIDLLKLEDPTTSDEWRQFRYDRITHLVNDILIPIAHKHKKLVTAAVFPNWEMVRQQWSAWKLDAVMPMLYNSFYNKDIEWIRKQTEKGVKSLPHDIPLYSGLFVPQLSPEALTKAIEASFEGGAKGVTIFSARAMTEAHWQSFSRAVKRQIPPMK